MQNETTPNPASKAQGTSQSPAGNLPAEKRAKLFDNAIKITSTLIAVAGFIFGVYTFQAGQQTTQTQSFKMKLWDKKLEVYNQLAGISGDIIIYRNDSTALDSLTDKFDKLYYSSLILVQNDSVEAKVRIYKEALADYRKRIKSILFLKDKQIALMRKIGDALKENQDFGK